jgi:hypothetical protein
MGVDYQCLSRERGRARDGHDTPGDRLSIVKVGCAGTEICINESSLQGYLDHKKLPPQRNLAHEKLLLHRTLQ